MQIAGGDLDARVEIGSSRDEVAELARSFNKMADDLQIHIRRIAEQDAARSRVEYELDLAKSIQVRLLPSAPPSIPGYDIAGWNRPADKTGGDYFDWQQLPDGRLVVSIADASGHGIGPALVTAVCRAYVRASFPSGHEMATLVGRVNDLLSQDLDGSRFVTFAAAVLDAHHHTLELVSAGHGPQFHIRPSSGTVTRYGSQGLPLAIESSTVYEPAEPLRMEPGDVLVLVTDGFFEWPGPDKKMFGTERLSKVLQEAAARPASEIIQAAYEAVLAHAAGTRQEDDLTAVVIKRIASS
jgi:serine phosphatase RsbU (regulator of sigma subunit)